MGNAVAGDLDVDPSDIGPDFTLNAGADGEPSSSPGDVPPVDPASDAAAVCEVMESDGDRDTLEAVYAVSGADELELVFGEVDDWHLALWDRFATLIPREAREDLDCFEPHSSDEESEGSAWVLAQGFDLDSWRFAFFEDDLGRDTDSTLIHEFGHLWTLDDEQLNEKVIPRVCDTWHPGEGCPDEGSLMREFVDRYWDDDLLADVEEELAAGDYGGDASWERYVADPQAYVSDYAAATPAEDMAETFAVFVLEREPVGDEIADEKIRFFWEHPPSVAIREQIRSRR